MLYSIKVRLISFHVSIQTKPPVFISGLYLFTKLLFCTNVVCQFFLLDAFLGGFYSYWGIEAMYTLAAEHEVKESRRFPRVTICDFIVRNIKHNEVSPWEIKYKHVTVVTLLSQYCTLNPVTVDLVQFHPVLPMVGAFLYSDIQSATPIFCNIQP